MREIGLCTQLSLRSLYGINRMLHLKDKKARRRSLWMAVGIAFVLLVCMGYVAGIVIGLHAIGLGGSVPMCLAFIASLVIFVFGLFRAGDRLFAEGGLEILSALPIQSSSIAVGRLLSLLLEDCALVMLIFLPGVTTHAVLAGESSALFACSLAGVVLLPPIPLALSAILGVAIKRLTAGLRHKSILQTVLMLVPLLGLMVFSWFVDYDGLSDEMVLGQITAITTQAMTRAERLYPPAMWLGRAMQGGAPGMLARFVLCSISAFGLCAFLLVRFFSPLVRLLAVGKTKWSAQAQEFSLVSVQKALFVREAKRYFASTIYVSNTIVGPIMGMLLAIALLVAGAERIAQAVPLPLDAALPIGIGAVFCMMPTTCSAISLEGKQVWVLKTLPISAKDYVNSKLHLNIAVALPFFVIAEVLVCIVLSPVSAATVLGICSATALLLFSIVFGLFINIKMHRFDWEKEEAIVKQSAAAGIGGFGGMLLSMLLLAAAILLPGQLLLPVGALLFLVVLLGTWLFYRACMQTVLAKL